MDVLFSRQPNRLAASILTLKPALSNPERREKVPVLKRLLPPARGDQLGVKYRHDDFYLLRNCGYNKQEYTWSYHFTGTQIILYQFPINAD